MRTPSGAHKHPPVATHDGGGRDTHGRLRTIRKRTRSWGSHAEADRDPQDRGCTHALACGGLVAPEFRDHRCRHGPCESRVACLAPPRSRDRHKGPKWATTNAEEKHRMRTLVIAACMGCLVSSCTSNTDTTSANDGDAGRGTGTGGAVSAGGSGQVGAWSTPGPIRPIAPSIRYASITST